MGEWREVSLYPKASDGPCAGCQSGWGSISCKEENGKYYQKVDDCTKTCKHFKDWMIEGYKSLSDK